MRIHAIKTLAHYGERPLSRVRLFISTKDESVLENLEFRHSRPYKTYRAEILPEVFERLKVQPLDVKWSQKAGCSCGCSPGYLVDLVPAAVGYEAIYVTIKK